MPPRRSARSQADAQPLHRGRFCLVGGGEDLGELVQQDRPLAVEQTDRAIEDVDRREPVLEQPRRALRPSHLQLDPGDVGRYVVQDRLLDHQQAAGGRRR
jgi:hypothetical protein